MASSSASAKNPAAGSALAEQQFDFASAKASPLPPLPAHIPPPITIPVAGDSSALPPRPHTGTTVLHSANAFPRRTTSASATSIGNAAASSALSNPVLGLMSLPPAAARPSLEPPLTPNSYLTMMMGDLHLIYQEAKEAIKATSSLSSIPPASKSQSLQTGAIFTEKNDMAATIDTEQSIVPPITPRRSSINAISQPVPVSVVPEEGGGTLDDIYGYYADPAAETMSRNRARAAQEVVTTEITYVEMLTVLIECVILPLRDAGKRSNKKMPSDELFTLFGNVEEILNLHRILLAGLQERYTMWTEEQRISDIFSSMVPFFKMYIQYMANYSSSLETLTRCRKQYPEFSKFIDSVQASPRFKGLQLLSLMIMPIQRVPRYIMLLQALLNFTTESHPDYCGLIHCLSEMRHIADHINESIREFESQKRVLEIQAHLTGRPSSLGPLVLPSRHFVAQMEVHKPSNPVAKRTIFLMNDLALLVKRINDEKYEYKDEIVLNSRGWVQQLYDDPKEFVFHIVTPEKSWSLVAPSIDEQESYCTLIESAMQGRAGKRISASSTPISAQTVSGAQHNNINSTSMSRMSGHSQHTHRLSGVSVGSVSPARSTGSLEPKRRSATTTSTSTGVLPSMRSSMPPPRRDSMATRAVLQFSERTSSNFSNASNEHMSTTGSRDDTSTHQHRRSPPDDDMALFKSASAASLSSQSVPR